MTKKTDHLDLRGMDTGVTDVSVLTPSLGYGRFIRDNLLSVREQQGVSVEHIVQDAGSTDETLDVLREFGDTVEWVSEPDQGQSDALNRALTKATGRWIGWLNADEFYLPGALATLIEHGEAREADVVFADNVVVNEGGRVLRLLPQHRFSRSVLRLYGCFIASSSVLIRRSALRSDPWDTELQMMMDWELYLALVSRGARFVDVAYPAAAFRRHGERVTARSADEFAHEYSRVFARYRIDPRRRRWGRWLHAANKLASGSHLRQMRARPLHGQDIRWFVDGPGSANFDRLLHITYRRSALPDQGSPETG